MTFDQIMANLSQGNYAPYYFLHGTESYYIDKITDFIENQVLHDAEKAFNQLVIYGKETDFKTILDNARQFPMMASRRVIIVKEAQELSDLDKLKGFFEQPSPHSIVVFAYKHKKLDKRKAVAKAIAKNGVFFETPTMYDNQVPTWISDYIKKKGYNSNPQVNQLLSEYIGGNLSKLSNEIDKLFINKNPGDTIKLEDVHTNIGISKDYNVFEFQKALGQKNYNKCVLIAQHFGDNPKEHPIPMLVGSLYQYFTKVMITRANLNKNDNMIAGLIGLRSSYFVKEYRQAASNYNATELQEALLCIEAADQHSKGIGARRMGESEIMKELVYGIMSA